jgi:hypothetical protein
MSEIIPFRRRGGWLAPIGQHIPSIFRPHVPSFLSSAGGSTRPPFVSLDEGESSLRKIPRACVLPASLLIALCATSFAALIAFVFMLTPHWADVPGPMYDAPPGGRAVCFLICVLGSWAADLILKALRRWWERVRGREPAADFRPWLRRAARTAVDLYWTSSAVTVLAFAVLVLENALNDPNFTLAMEVILLDSAAASGASTGLIAGEIARLPYSLSLPAAIFVLSFIPAAFIKSALSDERAARS